MKTFKFIFRQLINLNENINNKYLYALKYCLESNECYKTKIQYFTTYILNNQISTKDEIQEIENLYFKTRKIYDLLSRTAFIYKYKKSIYMPIDHDLYLNNLDNFKDNHIYTLYDPCIKCKFKFRVADLMRVIEDSLSYNQDFFIKPMWPKNPYTNVNFSTYSLINFYIHLFLQKTPFNINPLFNLFVKYNFSLVEFEDKTISLLKDYAIKDAVTNSSAEKKALDIREMLYDVLHNDDHELAYLDYNFPNDILVNTFSKYLKKYYTSFLFKYTRNGNIALTQLSNEINDFVRLNPTFGRKIMKFTNKRYVKDENGNIIKISDKLKYKYIFITDVVNENSISINNYLPHINLNNINVLL